MTKVCPLSPFFSKTAPQSMKNNERTHSDEKPVHCKTCAKSFIHLSYLKKHEKNHTGEKPYYCQTCEKSFGDTTKLKT